MKRNRSKAWNWVFIFTFVMIMLLGMTVAVSAKEYTSDSIGSDGIYLEDGDEVDIIGKTLLI